MSPFLLVLSLLIRLETPGPALFKQRRTGLNGTTFIIYKFRTMRVVEDGVEIVQASENDQRTTPLGRFLRRSSVDELPQMLNVLKGEMSLIGPRPHALAHDAYYGDLVPGYETRFLVRPGLSGLAQVRGCRGATPETEMMAARVQWDLAYIENWSLGLEAQIFLETIRVFFLHPAPF
jgi:putative colanic acid biosynthesis UDP-glucose lipid carrier transferase